MTALLLLAFLCGLVVGLVVATAALAVLAFGVTEDDDATADRVARAILAGHVTDVSKGRALQ